MHNRIIFKTFLSHRYARILLPLLSSVPNGKISLAIYECLIAANSAKQFRIPFNLRSLNCREIYMVIANGETMDNNGATNETRVQCLRVGEKRRVITDSAKNARKMGMPKRGGSRSPITGYPDVGCLIIRIMPTPINEPDGNTR